MDQYTHLSFEIYYKNMNQTKTWTIRDKSQQFKYFPYRCLHINGKLESPSVSWIIQYHDVLNDRNYLPYIHGNSIYI